MIDLHLQRSRGHPKTRPFLLVPWLCLPAYLFSACTPSPSDAFQGYIEAEYIYAAAPLAGTLETLSVARGMSVETAAPLFTLEHAAELAAQREAEHRLAQARARLADLRQGKRPSEIAALEAQLQHARQ